MTPAVDEFMEMPGTDEMDRVAKSGEAGIGQGGSETKSVTSAHCGPRITKWMMPV